MSAAAGAFPRQAAGEVLGPLRPRAEHEPVVVAQPGVPDHGRIGSRAAQAQGERVVEQRCVGALDLEHRVCDGGDTTSAARRIVRGAN